MQIQVYIPLFDALSLYSAMLKTNENIFLLCKKWNMALEMLLLFQYKVKVRKLSYYNPPKSKLHIKESNLKQNCYVSWNHSMQTNYIIKKRRTRQLCIKELNLEQSAVILARFAKPFCTHLYKKTKKERRKIASRGTTPDIWTKGFEPFIGFL